MKTSKPTILCYITRLRDSNFCQIYSTKRGRENIYRLEHADTLAKVRFKPKGLQQLALCRDFMLHLFPHSMQFFVDAVLQQGTAFLPQDDIANLDI